VEHIYYVLSFRTIFKFNPYFLTPHYLNHPFSGQTPGLRGKKVKLQNAGRPLQNVQFCSSSRKAKILTTGISWIFRGLKFETDAEIGQKGTLCKGLARRMSNGKRVYIFDD